MQYTVANYDVDALGKFHGLKGLYNKRVTLWFQDGDFSFFETVEIGGNIIGIDLLEFAIDSIIDNAPPPLYYVFAKNKEGDELVIDCREQLEKMLVKYQVDKVFQRTL